METNTGKKSHSGDVPFSGAPVWSAAQAAEPAGLQRLLCYICSYNALAAVWPVVKKETDVNFHSRSRT